MRAPLGFMTLEFGLQRVSVLFFVSLEAQIARAVCFTVWPGESQVRRNHS